VRLHKSSLGSAKLKRCLHSSTIEVLFVQNNFIRILLTQKSRDCKSALFEGQTSKPYRRRGLQFCRWQHGSIFIRLEAIIVSQICEMTRNSDKIRTSTSSNVINLGANRKRMYNFLLVTGRISYRFSRYWRKKPENCLLSPPHLVWRPRYEESVRISGCNITHKN